MFPIFQEVNQDWQYICWDLICKVVGFHDGTVQGNWKALVAWFLGITGKLNLCLWFLHLVMLGRWYLSIQFSFKILQSCWSVCCVIQTESTVTDASEDSPVNSWFLSPSAKKGWTTFRKYLGRINQETRRTECSFRTQMLYQMLLQPIFSLYDIISKIWGLLICWKVHKITCFYNRDAGIPK